MRIFLLLMTPILTIAETECLQVPGDRIHAGDLAQKVGAFRNVSADVEVGLAPLPGGRRTLTATELQRIAAKNGIHETIQSDLCVQMQTRLPQVEEIKQAIELELQNQKVQNATVEILDFSRYQVPEGKLQFTKAGLTPPAQNNSALQAVLWRGRMIYGGSRSVPVWARIRMFVEAEVPIAAKDIAAAATIGDDDVTVETRRVFPFGGAPLAEARTVTGKRTKRALKSGDPITAAVLENPKEVERGDKVEVVVSGGAVQLRLDAIAESSGQVGERIPIKNVANGKRFQAIVESKGHVTVSGRSEEQK